MTMLKDPLEAAKAKGWVVQCFEPMKGDGVQAPGAVTLCKLPNNPNHPFVVHFFNAQDGGFYHGNYCVDLEEAKKAYRTKIDRYARHDTENRAFSAIDPPGSRPAYSMNALRASRLRREYGD